MSDETKCICGHDRAEHNGPRAECDRCMCVLFVATPPTPDPRERGLTERGPHSDREWLAVLAQMTRGSVELGCINEPPAFCPRCTRVARNILDALAALRAPAPSEAVAEVATDGGYLRWRLNGTGPLDSIELRLPSGTWVSVNGNNSVAVTVERVQAWARLTTHPAPAPSEAVGALNYLRECVDAMREGRDGDGVFSQKAYELLDELSTHPAPARGVTEAARNVLLAFHDWPAYQSDFADGERRRALDSLTAALTPDAEGGA